MIPWFDDWIYNNDETKYRKENENLVSWFQVNNLAFCINKTKELVVDLRN